MHRSRRSLAEIDHCFRQLLPPQGRRQLLKFLPLAVLGVLLSGSCHLNRIAAALACFGTVKRLVQRLRRWLARDVSAVEAVLVELARGFVASCAPDPLPLLIDRTQWKHANLLTAAVPFRGRAIPIATIILDGPKSTNAHELRQLLRRAARVVPAEAKAVVIGDREFGDIPAIRAIRAYHWHFCLRFKEDTWLWSADGTAWQARRAFPPRGGRRFWPNVRVTLQRYGPLHSAVVWHRAEDEPWLLVSDLPCEKLYPLYRQRMRIEQIFSDWKRRGFNLEATRVRNPQRLLWLVLLLCLAYIWLLLVAWQLIRRGGRATVDPAARRALSYFQIGLRILQHQPDDTIVPLLRAAARIVQPK